MFEVDRTRTSAARCPCHPLLKDDLIVACALASGV